MTNKKTNNGSARKKLIPAAGMLAISAMMLASSTYAWFTMSKEVEVTGIKMTASVPENIQVSLGAGTNSSSGLTGATFAEVAGTSRTLTVSNPSGEANSTDWSNTVDVAAHYTFGRLTPATSINGAHIYFTPDAQAMGVKLPEDLSASEKVASGKYAATFTQADASNSVNQAWAEPNDELNTSMGDTFTTKDKTGGGYYIDIPVWFRTSIKEDNSGLTTDKKINLAVKATITPGRNATTGEALETTTPDIYKAARCAFIDSTGGTVGAIMDMTTKYYHNSTQAQSTAGYAPAEAYTINGTGTTGEGIATKNTWAAVDPVTQATGTDASGLATGGEYIIQIPINETTNNYSAGEKYTLRIWLEGEDINCWDETAAQDFQIDLRLIRMPAST